MSYWLIKSEPESWSWDMQIRAGASPWTGVRNHAAKKNLMAMKKGDLAFFYHTGEEKQIVGIAEITREAYPDPMAEGEPWVAVDVKAKTPFKQPVSLASIKAEPKLAKMPLVSAPRLSVQPVSKAEWNVICKMGGV